MILECTNGNENNCIRHLATVTPTEFSRLVDIVELRDKVYEKRIGLSNEGSSTKRPLRSNAGTQGT